MATITAYTQWYYILKAERDKKDTLYASFEGGFSSTDTRKNHSWWQNFAHNYIYYIAAVGQLRAPVRNLYAHTGNFARLHLFFVGFSYANIKNLVGFYTFFICKYRIFLSENAQSRTWRCAISNFHNIFDMYIWNFSFWERSFFWYVHS